MTKPDWPLGDRVHVANVAVPHQLLDAAAPAEADADGLKRVDLVLDGPTVSGILAAGSPATGPTTFDADGGQAWPCFTDLHTHLDKGQVWPRAANLEGTLEMARERTRADTIAYWRAEDVEARFEFALQAAYAHGTAAIRTHIDCLVPGQAKVSFTVFNRLKARWAGRIELQAACLVGPALYDNPDAAGLPDLIATAGGALGGITRHLSESEDPGLLDDKLDRLFLLAAKEHLDVDLHVDENGIAASQTLSQIAAAVLRNSFRGKVVCGHCCSLSVQEDAVAARTIRMVREAGITVVCLPLVNQHLQGRMTDATPRWRGITLLRELAAAGVPVALASDNCRDAYHPFGDLDLLEVLGGGIRMGHLHADIGQWVGSVGRIPASVMGCGAPDTMRAGCRADFVIFHGRSHSEVFARGEPDRLVIRNGQPIDTTLPDYRMLDRLMPALSGDVANTKESV